MNTRYFDPRRTVDAIRRDVSVIQGWHRIFDKNRCITIISIGRGYVTVWIQFNTEMTDYSDCTESDKNNKIASFNASNGINRYLSTILDLL